MISMTLLLPDEKVDKILCACQNLLTCVNPSVREVAHVIGLLVSAFPAVNFLKLHYRSIELCKSQALSVNPDFDQKIQLDPCARSDLRWVNENISQLNRFMFGNRPADVSIECNASLAGWGAVCNGQTASAVDVLSKFGQQQLVMVNYARGFNQSETVKYLNEYK